MHAENVPEWVNSSARIRRKFLSSMESLGLDVSLLGRDSGDFSGTLGTFVTLETFYSGDFRDFSTSCIRRHSPDNIHYKEDREQ